MTKELMEYLLDGVLKQHIAIIETFCREMPQDEFDKIPTILMSAEDVSVIEKNAIVFYPMRDGMDAQNYKDYALYSFGSTPFKIKIKLPTYKS